MISTVFFHHQYVTRTLNLLYSLCTKSGKMITTENQDDFRNYYNKYYNSIVTKKIA